MGFGNSFFNKHWVKSGNLGENWGLETVPKWELVWEQSLNNQLTFP